MSGQVYLAGPIEGLTYADATTWRDKACTYLRACGITGLSPLRFKPYLPRDRPLGNADGQDHALSQPRAIMARDRFDCTRADVVLVNLLGAKKVSIGTVMELAWAHLDQIPTVVIMEPDGSNPHEHAMVQQAIDFRVTALEEGLATVVAVIG